MIQMIDLKGLFIHLLCKWQYTMFYTVHLTDNSDPYKMVN